MKERREVWGIYDWCASQWWTEADEKTRLTFDECGKAILYLKERTWHTTSSVRRFFKVKKSDPRLERAMVVIAAAREYRAIEANYGGSTEQHDGWARLDKALRAYDGETSAV